MEIEMSPYDSPTERFGYPRWMGSAKYTVLFGIVLLIFTSIIFWALRPETALFWRWVDISALLLGGVGLIQVVLDARSRVAGWQQEQVMPWLSGNLDTLKLVVNSLVTYSALQGAEPEEFGPNPLAKTGIESGQRSTVGRWS